MVEISDISQIKGFIEMYSLALMALAFTVYTLLAKRVTSFNLVLVSCIVLHIVHAYITRALLPLFNIPELYSTVSYVWYLSFGITDLMLIYVCIRLIGRYELLKDRASYLIIIVFGFMASLQFIDLALTQFGIYGFGNIYSNGVVFSNIAITIIPCLMALRVSLVRLGAVIISVREAW